MTRPREKLRNLGIIAHVDAGKTTLTERVLYFTDSVRQVGEVHDGNTVTDHDAIEKGHGITISAAATAPHPVFVIVARLVATVSNPTPPLTHFPWTPGTTYRLRPRHHTEHRVGGFQS